MLFLPRGKDLILEIINRTTFRCARRSMSFPRDSF